MSELILLVCLSTGRPMAVNDAGVFRVAATKIEAADLLRLQVAYRRMNHNPHIPEPRHAGTERCAVSFCIVFRRWADRCLPGWKVDPVTISTAFESNDSLRNTDLFAIAYDGLKDSCPGVSADVERIVLNVLRYVLYAPLVFFLHSQFLFRYKPTDLWCVSLESSVAADEALVLMQRREAQYREEALASLASGIVGDREAQRTLYTMRKALALLQLGCLSTEVEWTQSSHLKQQLFDIHRLEDKFGDEKKYTAVLQQLAHLTRRTLSDLAAYLDIQHPAHREALAKDLGMKVDDVLHSYRLAFHDSLPHSEFVELMSAVLRQTTDAGVVCAVHRWLRARGFSQEQFLHRALERLGGRIVARIYPD